MFLRIQHQSRFVDGAIKVQGQLGNAQGMVFQPDEFLLVRSGAYAAYPTRYAEIPIEP